MSNIMTGEQRQGMELDASAVVDLWQELTQVEFERLKREEIREDLREAFDVEVKRRLQVMPRDMSAADSSSREATESGNELDLLEFNKKARKAFSPTGLKTSSIHASKAWLLRTDNSVRLVYLAFTYWWDMPVMLGTLIALSFSIMALVLPPTGEPLFQDNVSGSFLNQWVPLFYLLPALPVFLIAEKLFRKRRTVELTKDIASVYDVNSNRLAFRVPLSSTRWGWLCFSTAQGKVEQKKAPTPDKMIERTNHQSGDLSRCTEEGFLMTPLALLRMVVFFVVGLALFRALAYLVVNL